ncbi:phycobilisome rod-core linker polypeptide [Synechococcus sp. M16CYN]|uniref:phycobilisome rod-core linker polypeptide n=1 Tax=Synechococcus sp. M16CYN TaxID=3103139 RepID=UPI00324E8B7F
MTVTASSGSPRVSPQLFSTLPLASVSQAEQQDRFPDSCELDTLATFFRSGQDRLEASRIVATNAEAIVARAANRIFVGGTPLSFLDAPLSTGETAQIKDATPLASDQAAFADSVRTFTGASDSTKKENFLSRLLSGAGGGDADVRVVLPIGFNAISVAKYGPAFMRKSVRDMGWFLRYVDYALVAGDPSILAVNTRGLRDILEANCSLAATNVALQEMRAASALLLKNQPTARQLVIDCFNVLLKELAVPTPSTRQRQGSKVQQGLQLPAIYALAAEGSQRFEMRPGLSGSEKAEIIRAAYRQIFERDIVKGYSQTPGSVEASQVAQGQISMREFIRALGRSKEYRQQFHDRFVNSRVVELAYRHFLGRGISSLEEFRKSFAILSAQGLSGLVDVLVNSAEYAQNFGEETVPYLRDLGENAQESAGWGSNRRLFSFSAPFEGVPQYITLYASYRQPLADQHAYGGSNDPVANQYGAIFPSSTASIRTRPAPYGYDSRRLLVSNGMDSPGQMGSTQFRNSRPRRVGPRVIRLQQIATGGAAKPQRGGQPSVRNTESSTQAVINAVYIQVLGNAGYSGERLSSAEARLENGEICLREFVRSIARSDAFRRRYWSGLYITKAIAVMHRRLLGRPTFGRWEIDALFDTAARGGFYGVVDALVNGGEYGDCFGEDTVPYERFITPSDLNMRRVSTFKREVKQFGYDKSSFVSGNRPDASTSKLFRGIGEITRRNLTSQEKSSGTDWSNLAQSFSKRSEDLQASLRQIRINKPIKLVKLQSQNQTLIGIDPMVRALAIPGAEGYRLRSGLPDQIQFDRPCDESELIVAINATYQQIFNRIPLQNERLIEAESRLRNEDTTLSEFIAEVAMSETFQTRLFKMAPLRAASAASLALLGRAATPSEVRRFITTRAQVGQPSAIRELLKRRTEEKTVPRIDGMNTNFGIAQVTLQRTAALYRGNAGLNPPIDAAM